MKIESQIMKVISWGLLIIGSGFTVVTWSYATFEQKETARERKEDIVRRLDVIEAKIDRLMMERR
jgi:hypothetical protein